MRKPHLWGAVCACLSIFTVNASAALIDNGTYTTDPGSGLDWLDLTFTDGLSYNAAPASNPGWRYATNEEVVNLFWIAFDGFYANGGGGTSNSDLDGVYADQTIDVANWQDLFGLTDNGDTLRSYGLYEDENSVLRILGAADVTTIMRTVIFGPDSTNNYDDYHRTIGNPQFGVFMVRETTVPIPTSILLFGSGLLGLVGMARRRRQCRSN